jgi:hypothetical protein
MKERELLGWNDVIFWKDFRPSYISEDVWVEYIQHVMSARFTRRSQSDTDNQNRRVHGYITKHTSGSVLFILHAKRII